MAKKKTPAKKAGTTKTTKRKTTAKPKTPAKDADDPKPKKKGLPDFNAW